MSRIPSLDPKLVESLRQFEKNVEPLQRSMEPLQRSIQAIISSPDFQELQKLANAMPPLDPKMKKSFEQAAKMIAPLQRILNDLAKSVDKMGFK